MMTREEAYIAIAAVEGAALALAGSVERETELEDARPLIKGEAIKRLMESALNPLTGKPHSVSSAEAVVERDPQYMEHRRTQRAAVCDTIVMRAKLHAAELRARLAVELAAIDEQAKEPEYEIVGEHCPDCNGTGDGERDPKEGTLPCKRCHGKGVLP